MTNPTYPQIVAQDAVQPETIDDAVYRLAVKHMEPSLLIKQAQFFLEEALRMHEAGEPQSGTLPALSQAFSALATATYAHRTAEGLYVTYTREV